MFMAAGIGLFATLCYEPRQVRKEATVIADAGAEVRLMLVVSILASHQQDGYSSHQEESMTTRFLLVNASHLSTNGRAKPILRMLAMHLPKTVSTTLIYLLGLAVLANIWHILAKCLNCETISP